MRRPVLLGMNNPHSERSEHALFPHPSGVAGHRLWMMAHDVCGMSRAEYLRVFDRRNLLNATKWDPIEARRVAEEIGLWKSLEGCSVVVLGQATHSVLWLEAAPPLLWRLHRGVRWCFAPHPSGLNRWYNDPLNRLAVGYRLEELASEALSS